MSKKERGRRARKRKVKGRNWCLILKINIVLFCTHRGTMSSCLQLSPYLGPLHKVHQFLFLAISHSKTRHKYDRRQTRVVVMKHVVRRYRFSEQTRTSQVARSHANNPRTILTKECPSLLLPSVLSFALQKYIEALS